MREFPPRPGTQLEAMWGEMFKGETKASTLSQKPNTTKLKPAPSRASVPLHRPLREAFPSNPALKSHLNKAH